MFEHIRADFRRYHDARRGSRFAFVAAALEYGFIATLVYRYGRWTRTIRPRLLSYPFKLAYIVLRFFVHVLFGIDVSTNADIGPGLHIGHFGGIFLHGDMGRNCSVGQGVTIGFKGAGKSGQRPRVGDDVYIGAGAFVIGAIRIGDRVVVGANTTVVSDVPDDHVVVGAPTRSWVRTPG
jgi:serine O-acetyltransferase